jgi:hypothetical protein
MDDKLSEITLKNLNPHTESPSHGELIHVTISLIFSLCLRVLSF